MRTCSSGRSPSTCSAPTTRCAPRARTSRIPTATRSRSRRWRRPSTRRCSAPTVRQRRGWRRSATRCGSSCASSGARVGVAYFAELDTDMTSRGFGTEAASQIRMGPRRVAPLEEGIDAIERGDRPPLAPRGRAAVGRRRSCRSGCRASGWWSGYPHRGLDQALEIARGEHAPLTTELPEERWKPAAISTLGSRTFRRAELNARTRSCEIATPSSSRPHRRLVPVEGARRARSRPAASRTPAPGRSRSRPWSRPWRGRSQ